MSYAIKKDELICATCLFMSIFLFFIGALFENNETIIIATVLLTTGNIVFSFFSFFNRSIFFAFNVTFFTFIVARPVVKIFSNYQDSYNDTKFGLDFFDKSITSDIFQVVYLSLIGLTLGYLIFHNRKKFQWGNNNLEVRTDFDKILRWVSKLFYYFTFIFAVLITLEKAKFTSAEGYYSLYSSYTTNYPYLFTKISEMNQISFFLFLGSCPTKREIKFPILLYTLLGCIYLLVGQRNIFVLNILIIFIYLSFRTLINDNEIWLTKKGIILGVVSVPILITLLNIVNAIRMNLTGLSLNNSFLNFFYSQGVSINLIGHAEYLKENTDKGWQFYSLGRLIDFFYNNSITSLFFNFKPFKSQTVESALYGHSFADFVSYWLSPIRYVQGWGYGSSYLAEIFYDFGKIGIFIYNFILGFSLLNIKKLFNKGPVCLAISLSVVRLILYSPRDTTLSFLVNTFNIVNIVTIILIYLVSITIANKKNEDKFLFRSKRNIS